MGASLQPYRYYKVLQCKDHINHKQTDEGKTPNKTNLMFTALAQSQGCPGKPANPKTIMPHSSSKRTALP